MLSESYQKWLNNGQPKVYCQCPCSREIIIIKSHKYDGIPKYILGHSSNKNSINESYKNWLINKEKIFCGCGCGQEIIIKKHHRWYGIPKYIKGHNPCTEEGRQKMREFQSNRSPPSEETKLKQRNKALGKHVGKKSGRYGKPPKHGKHIYYNSPLQGIICFRSLYEIAYAKYLDSINEFWYYEIETFDLGDTTYTPDFFLPRRNKFIEIKGYMHKKSQDKINKFLEQYPWKLEILFKKDLIKLGCKL